VRFSLPCVVWRLCRAPLRCRALYFCRTVKNHLPCDDARRNDRFSGSDRWSSSKSQQGLICGGHATTDRWSRQGCKSKKFTCGVAPRLHMHQWPRQCS
jgi:hypothetical protein